MFICSRNNRSRRDDRAEDRAIPEVTPSDSGASPNQKIGATPATTVYVFALSPFSAKVRCFLNLKGLDYEVYYVNPLQQDRELAFSGQRKVPVLRFGEEVKIDSTPIGLWLDEKFPDTYPLLPQQEPLRKKLLDIDHWISNELMATSFRNSQLVPFRTKLRNGWRSAAVVDRTTPGGIPWWLKAGWPLLIKFAGGHIRTLINSVPDNDSSAMQRRVCEQFIAHLEEGPFLAGQNQPSIPDCAAYAHFMLPYLHGLDGYGEFTAYGEIRRWANRMTELVNSPLPLVEPQNLAREPMLADSP